MKYKNQFSKTIKDYSDKITGLIVGSVALFGLSCDKPVDAQPSQPSQPKIVQQSDLENKIINVKDNLETCLSETEYSMDELYDYTFSLLKEVGILEGDKNSRDNIEMNVRIATRLTYNLGAEEHWGLEKRYITLKDEDSLSERVRNDLDNYNKINKEVKEYLDQEIGQTEIYKKDYENLVKNYVDNNFKLINDRVKSTTWVRVEMGLKDQYNIVENPDIVGRYNTTKINDALDKLD